MAGIQPWHVRMQLGEEHTFYRVVRTIHDPIVVVVKRPDRPSGNRSAEGGLRHQGAYAPDGKLATSQPRLSVMDPVTSNPDLPLDPPAVKRPPPILSDRFGDRSTSHTITRNEEAYRSNHSTKFTLINTSWSSQFGLLAHSADHP